MIKIIMPKYLFLGGPGLISTSTAESLLDAGRSLAILTHSSSNREENNHIINRAKMYYSDRNDSEALKTAIGEYKPDIIIDYTCFSSEQCRQIIEFAYGKTHGKN